MPKPQNTFLWNLYINPRKLESKDNNLGCACKIVHETKELHSFPLIDSYMQKDSQQQQLVERTIYNWFIKTKPDFTDGRTAAQKLRLRLALAATEMCPQTGSSEY